MSASSSNMTPSPLGECVVCGKESSTRCSKCSQGGVNWMFFCSREHQKLIWPVHSRVCGGSFEWPPLKPTERAEMLELTTTPMKEDGKTITWAWAKSFESQLQGGVSHVGHTARCNCVKEMLQAGIKNVDTDQAVLYDFRGSAFSVKIGSKVLKTNRLSNGDFCELVVADPFGCLAFSQSCHLRNWVEQFDAAWYSEFQHLSVVVVALIRDLWSDKGGGGNRPEPTLLDYTLNRVRAIARSEISPLNPSLAKTILEVWLPTMLADVGIKMTPEA